VFGLTPLALSCYFNGLESVTYLLNRSANIETFDNCGRTPLHLAVLKGNEVPLLMTHSSSTVVENKNRGVLEKGLANFGWGYLRQFKFLCNSIGCE